MDKNVNQNQDELYDKFIAKFGKDGKFLLRIVRGKDYQQVVRDLVAYTGLTFDEVCKRIMFKSQDHLHFVDEYRWESPNSTDELNWFYRACRGYLFGNASRPRWDALEFLNRDLHSPVLDYGGGIGQNSVWLAENGFRVYYFDISVIQSDFVRFRAAKRKLEIKIVDPYFDGRFNFIECIPKNFKTIVIQDVLEHIPRYKMVLQNLVSCLDSDGIIVEYSPFNGKKQGKFLPKYSPLHVTESVPLDELMTSLKMKKTDLGKFPATVWKRSCE